MSEMKKSEVVQPEKTISAQQFDLTLNMDSKDLRQKMFYLLVGFSVVVPILSAYVPHFFFEPQPTITLISAGFAAGAGIFSLIYFKMTKDIRRAKQIAATSTMIAFIAGLAVSNGLHSEILIFAPTVILINGFLLLNRGIVWTTVAISVGVIAITILDSFGKLPHKIPPSDLLICLSTIIGLVTVAVQTALFETLRARSEKNLSEINKKILMEQEKFAIEHEQVRKLNQRFNMVFMSSPAPMTVLRKDGFIDCNTEALKLFGAVNREELIGKMPSDLSPKFQPDGRSSDELVQEVVRLAHENGSHRFDWQHRKLSGEDFPVEVTLTPIHWNDEDLMLAQLIDHSERELRHQQVIEASRLSSLGQMAGGIAHEINNPLATIRMKASQLRRLSENDKADKKTSIEFLSQIETTTERITKIINGLRTFSRDGTSDQFESTQISMIIKEIVDLCREKFKHREITLIVENENDVAVDCRHVEVGQVLLNLLNNSFDAVCDLPNPWVKFAATQIEDFIEISITDSGPGIPKHIADKLMVPFFTTKAIGKGTGLGLSISKGIIESHEGALTLDTNCKNTRFVVKLPIHQKPKPSPTKVGA